MRLVSPAVFLLLVGCSRASGTDATDARAALESVLAAGRRAHLETDADLLGASLADTLVSMNAGAVSLQLKDSVVAMFREYFTGATYHAWQDLVPPRILMAEHNSLAWVARVVCVDREEPPESGGRLREVFVSAYSATYAWRDGGWRMTTVTSTFLPEPPDACPPGGRT